MSRPTTAAALALALLILTAPPAAAKGPTEVEVHDLRTGETTELSGFDDHQLMAVIELVGWPEGIRPPGGMSSAKFEHIATLSWQYPEGMPAWVDRVYRQKRSGVIWVQRRDLMLESELLSWRRLEEPSAFEVVLAEIAAPDNVTTSSVAAPAADPSRNQTSGDDDDRFDGASFGWGAGLAGLLAAGLVLAAKWRRSRRPVVSGP